ncbi:MAG: homoserine dehydrogenase [Clostridia bacterium]|nr:homoserine dehydrogenase [Clostridia bacterium]
MIYVAIMGHGTVGSGVAEIMINHNPLVAEKVRDKIEVKYILELRDFSSLPYAEKFTDDFEKIVNDPEVKIVAEVMGGIHPAYEFVKRCLEAKKSVVTSNKELVAMKGAELLKIASENSVNFLFEASVGGGIPILRPMAQCLAANDINSVTGILNGTTNYVLNKMIVDDMSFDTALALAQEKGFAEKDPTADIEGHDTCRKICILASLAFGKHVYPEQVKTEGITNVTLEDVAYAQKLGCAIKLIARAKKLPGGHITAEVAPMLVSNSNMLSHVNGVFNAIMVHGDATGDVMFYGKGAGKMPTASAVVADIIDCAKHLHARKYFDWQEGEEGYVVPDTSKKRFFVLIKSLDFEAMSKSFNAVFPDNTWNIKNEFSGEIAFITDEDFEVEISKKLDKIKYESIKTMKMLF